MQRASRRRARPSQPGSISSSPILTDRSTTSPSRVTRSKTALGSPQMWVRNKVVRTKLYTQPLPPASQLPSLPLHLHARCANLPCTQRSLSFISLFTFLLTALVMYLVIIALPLLVSSPVFGNAPICAICPTCSAMLFCSCSNKITG